MQVTEHFDIIIIGAGASGLYAAHDLALKKMGVLVLEGQDRIGGRMYTNLPENFSAPIERGAEFVHGEAPLTLKILKKVKAEYVEMVGNIFQTTHDQIEKNDFFDSSWDDMLHELKKLKYDMPFAQFLSTRFGDSRHQELRDNARKFVEGYNAADLNKVSAMALCEEWTAEDDPAQYRIKGGYAVVYGHLNEIIQRNGGVIRLNQKVTQVKWAKGDVEVKVGPHTYRSKKCLITLPTSLLQTESLEFIPHLPQITKAASDIGYGGVVKINLEFTKAFWETDTPKKFHNLQFLFSEEVIPTWWSQVPDKRPLLTGWLGGPGADQLNQTDEQVFESAIVSLANAMNYPAKKIIGDLMAWKVDQWISNEYTLGAYSYGMVGTPEAVRVLQQPIEDTLYFAGEAIYSGPHKGTVEAALTSGADAANRIISG